MKTLQEKYNAILEGNFSKKQFVRDARLAHSNLITQFNSFADTVAILKNKGMVVEAKKVEVTAYKKPEVDPIDMVAPDLLDHGIEVELHAAGITGTPSEEEYAKAKEKAAKELIKDPLCYKNAQTMTEPGEKMEKAKLSEETALDRAEDHASRKVQDKLRDIADTVAEKPASIGAAFREKVLADPTHYGKMSAHELEKEFNEFKLEDMKVDKEADEEFDKMSGEPDPEIQEAKDLEISPEQMEKLHKDGKITLSNGSVLHYTGTVKEDSQLKSEIVLTPAEKAILQDLTESINEGMVDLSKVKDYAKKGLMTLGVIATLLGGANLTLQQKQDVVDTVKTEIPSENQKDLQHMSDAAIAHSLYLTHKADVEKLAETNSDVYLLIKDSKFQNFDKLDRVQDKITIGRSNQEAIQLIKGMVLEGAVKTAQLKEAVKSLIKKTLES